MKNMIEIPEGEYVLLSEEDVEKEVKQMKLAEQKEKKDDGKEEQMD
jgi:hypothetical protein